MPPITPPPTPKPTPSPDGRDVEQRLQQVLRFHDEISAAVLRISKELPRPRRRACERLGRWFAQAPTPQDVLHRTDALAVCLPLMTPAASGEIASWQIDEAARQAVSRFGSHRGQRYRLLQGLIYPLSVLLISGLIIILFCLFLVPEFDIMFQDFDLDLPLFTHALILLSRLIRQWGGVLLGGTAILGLMLLWLGKHNRERWMRSKRDVLAIWARHVSLLLQAGLADDEAIQTAGRASEHRWVSSLSRIWGEQLQQGQQPFDGPLYAGSQPVAMIGFAMRRQTPQQRSEWLGEVAEMYRERDHFRWNAWLAWTTPLVVCVAGGAVGFLVIALFLPLVGLISGLG